VFLAAGGLTAGAPPGVPAASPAEAPLPPTPGPPAFNAALAADTIPPGRGRMAILFDGNHRWCTFPDDRILRPLDPMPVRRERSNDQVFTFGYQFTIAAIRRDQPDRVLMLYESPVVRTASMRLAAKLGEGVKPAPGAPVVGSRPRPMLRKHEPGPSSLVPYWQEQFRCVSVSRAFEFDLDPGVYDVYASFDLLNRDGGWVHRTSGFLTDIEVESGRRTRVDGILDFPGGDRRQVELLQASVESDPIPPAPGGP
jgi:hypothetical protein